MLVKNKKSSPLDIHESSIVMIETSNAVSRSLLGSTAISGYAILKAVKSDTGLSAANFTFPGLYNVFTHPLTYPQYRSKNEWQLVNSYLKPLLINREKTHLFRSVTEESIAEQESEYFQSRCYEKIGGSDVSLSLYTSIATLSEKYSFENDVPSFLLNNKTLITFLNNAYEELISRFPESHFRLAVKSDEEVEDWISLFLYINSAEEDGSFQEDVQGFITDWMFKQNQDVKKIVTIAR